MRVASVLAYLAMAVVCLVFEVFLQDMADLVFAAGPTSLSTGAAWTGLLAFAFQVWFWASVPAYCFAAMKALRRQNPGWLANAVLDVPSYRATSIKGLWDPARGLVWGLTLGVSFAQHGANMALVAGFGLHLLFLALESRVGKGQALWHRLPGLLAWMLTFGIVLVSLLLMRSTSLAHAWQIVNALLGRNPLAEPSLLLNAQLFTDFNVLLLLASVVTVFVIPPLKPLVESAGRWKQYPAALVLLTILALTFLPSVQTHVQHWLVQGLGKGGNGVVSGQDGWLFDARELRALTGSGPLEPDRSVQGSPTSKARDEILAFAQGLKERGVPLLLIPIPMKASLYPEVLTRSDPDDIEAPLEHPAQAILYEQLANAGIDVQDISGALMQLKARHQDVFFKQDSHWTPEAMQEIARAVAVHVRKKYPGIAPDDPLIVDTKAPDAASFGDLAKRLYAAPGLVVGEEGKVLVSFPALDNDSASPITLLGDDFVRIFDDEKLGFASANATHAGFAQHLALYLGTRINTITFNHPSTNAVREALAGRFEDQIKAMKLVIWLVPARDLLLSPGAGVEWGKAPFNTQSSPPQVLEPMVPKGR